MSQPATATDGTYPTTCWECSTCCGALATVRNGRVAEFGPNRNHPYSKGAFCIKGIHGAPRYHRQDRHSRGTAHQTGWLGANCGRR